MATLLKASGETQLVTPANGKHFTLEELQGFVGGYIECLNTPANRILVLHEEGKFADKPVRNEAATNIARSCGIMPGDCIVGDVLWLTRAEMEPDQEEEQ